MIYDFLVTHPVFSREDFVAYREAKGCSVHPAAIKKLLLHYCSSCVIVRLRQNLFAANITKAKQVYPNTYLIAASMTSDSVLAYHTAMMVRGESYSMLNRHYYLSLRHVRPFVYRNQAYQALMPPKNLRKQGLSFIETDTLMIHDKPVKVTSLERTLVDSLYSPDFAGGWEELWRNFGRAASLRWDALQAYVDLFDDKRLHAKLGFYLSMRQTQGLAVPDTVLTALALRSPKQASYIDIPERFSPKQRWRFIKPWQLIVPEELVNQSFEEAFQETDLAA